MVKRVLITGLDGFVGRNLSHYLNATGYVVYGLVRKINHNISDTNIHYIEGNILHQKDLGEIIRSITPDIIFHFAALSKVGLSFSDPSAYLYTNGVGTANLLESVRQYCRGCRIVFASSAEVYGPIEYPSSVKTADDTIENVYLNEKQAIFPSTSPYSISKVCGEYLMDCYFRTYGLDTITVRSFNIEGPGRGDDFATSIISRQAAELKRNYAKGFTIGNLAVFRDFTHISDAVRAYTLIGTTGCKGSTYNLGSMQCTSLASYLLYAVESAGFPVDMVKLPNNLEIKHPLKEIVINSERGERITHLDQVLLNKPDLICPGKESFFIHSQGRNIPVHIDSARFRPADNPLIIADTTRLAALGYEMKNTVRTIASDQVQYYLNQDS